MIKRLLTYGDSFTAGDGINREQAWPIYLGNMLGLKTENKGVPGGSNKLSIITLLNDIAEISNDSSILVGFSWTAASRTCFYKQNWKNVLSHWDDYDQRVNNFSRAYYGHIYTDADGLAEMLMQQIMITTLLKQRKIKFFFINSMRGTHIDDIAFENDADKKTYLQNYNNFINLIDKDMFALGYDTAIKEIFCDQLNMYCDDGAHPSPDAHAMVAARIFWFLHDKKILINQQEIK